MGFIRGGEGPEDSAGLMVKPELAGAETSESERALQVWKECAVLRKQ